MRTAAGVLAIAGAVFACTPSAGRVAIRVTWEGAQPPEDPPLFVFARVEEVGTGRILGTGGPSQLTSSRLALPIEGVLVGAERTLIVEVRDSTSRASRVLHYAISAPFSLASGTDEVVEVPVLLRATPSFDKLGIVSPDDLGWVASSTISLVIGGSGAATVRVSNDVTFSAAATRSIALEPGRREWTTRWDLELGRVERCVDRDECPRRVFAVLRNGDGYESEVRAADVVLDTRAPAVRAPTAVLPAAATASTSVVVELVLSERAAAAPELFVPDVPGFGFERLLPAATAPSSTYTFISRQPAGALGADGSHEIRAAAADLAGNSAAELAVGRLTLDTRSPRVAALAVTPERVGRGRRQLDVTFTMSEDVPAQAVSVNIGRSSQSACARSGTEPAIVVACTATVGATVPLGVEEVQTLAVEVVDAAGNRGSAGASFVLDFKDPAVIRTSTAIQLDPPPGALVPRVAAATAGSRVRVSFTLDEPVVGAPVVFTSTPAALRFDLVTSAGTTYVFEHVVSTPAPPPGSYEVRYAATDRAGNAGSGPLGARFELDPTPPPPPRADMEGTLTLRRRPWGTDATGGLPELSLAGNPGAAEPGTTLVALDGPVPGQSGELGRGVVDARGAFGPLFLGRTDHDDVYVVAIDPAGNASTATTSRATPVRDYEWTATLAGKLPGRRSPNPHIVKHTHAFSPYSLTQDALTVEPTSAGDIAALARRGGGSLRIGSPRRWEQVRVLESTDTSTPAPGINYAMAYDPVRRRMVMFGGCTNGAAQLCRADTWEWDRRDWRQIVTAASPAPSRMFGQLSMTYDAARSRIVLLDGDAQLWGYDGNAWTRLGGPPRPVLDGGIVTYDARRGVLLVLVNARTWEERGGQLVEVTPPEGTPCGGSVGYDEASQMVALIDGDRGWVWNGTTWLGPAIDPPFPGGCEYTPAFYDARRQRVLILVLTHNGYEEVYEVRQRSGGSWTTVAEWPVGGTSGRTTISGQTFGVDSVTGELLLFGGSERSLGYYVERNNWSIFREGVGWVSGRLSGAGQPGTRRWHAMSYEPTSGLVLLHGGRHSLPDRNSTSNYYQPPGLWAFDGTSWRQISQPVAGGGTVGQALVYDSDTRRSLLFAYEDGWGVWDRGPYESPSLICRNASGPFGFSSAAYDPGRHAVVGLQRDTGETWEWSRAGPTWRRFGSPPALATSSSDAMVYDEAGSRVLALRDGASWTRTGTVWQSLPAMRLPVGTKLAYDRWRSRVVATTSSSTWEWVGGDWRNLPTIAPPPARLDFGLAMDELRRRLVLFGGGGT